MKPTAQNIPAPLFKKIRQTMPVVCVDLAVTNNKEFFLVKRINEPEKGKWFFPGGRVYKNESLIAAAKRKLKEETGLTSPDIELLGVYEYFAKTSAFPGVSTHTIDIVFHTPVKKRSIRLDSQSSEGRWFQKIEKHFHHEIKDSLKKLGFK